MYRTTRRSACVLSVLIIGLMFSLPASVVARATITIVKGHADLSDGDIGGEVQPDAAGNLHFHHFSQRGNFSLKSLQGDDIVIDGKQTVVLNGKLDQSFTGPFAGTYTVSTSLEGHDTVLWEGRVHGQVVQGNFTGRIIAYGSGPFAGMLLQLDILEDDSNADTFELIGLILAPRGQ